MVRTFKLGSTRRNHSIAFTLPVEDDFDARRSFGQVFTPRPIADWMAAWVCQDRPKTLLDPAVGTGVFIDAVAAHARRDSASGAMRIDGFEIDESLINRVRAPDELHVQLHRADFITVPFNSRYDAILANPPYIRHHEFQYGPSVWRNFDRLCGPAGGVLSRMTNLYGLFLLKIKALLAPRGRAAVITPAEWLNADFGTAIKALLLRENALDGIVHFDHAAKIFDGVLTTAAITLLRRGRESDDPVRLSTVSDARRLGPFSLGRAAKWRRGDLDAKLKWTPYFNAGAGLRQAIGPVLGDLARCTRGIATGANTFFTLRASELRHWGISTRDVTACITSADQIRTHVITARDVRRLIEADERVFLLRPRRPLLRSLRKYLAWGQDQGVHRRYLPSHRPVWYMPEERDPAPILVSVFTRGSFRFVWNRAGVLNLTAYHGIYPRREGRVSTGALVNYLCGGVGQRLLRRHCRIYADGLLKVEPRDVEKIPIPRSFLT
jgi:adenine-specific DNA-methyltransferase